MGLTFTRMIVATMDVYDIAACARGSDELLEAKCNYVSEPRSAASGTASAAFGRWGFLTRDPGTTEALLDIATNHPPHDLRGREILLCAQFLEDGLLARIDQDRQTRGALFELDDGVLHLHVSYIVE